MTKDHDLGRRSRARRLGAAIGLALLAFMTACTPSEPSPSGSGAATTALTVGLGYVPNVQFAQFYLAQQAGYYRDAGLSVTFENKIDPDLVTLVGQGSVDIGIADGTSVIPAVSQGIPIKYVTTIYAKFPNVVYAKATSGIHSAADLKGRKLGTPGKYGSSWIMLQALLASVGLKPSDLDIQLYPDFGQGTALARGAVDAATGFVNNEPVQLELSGTKATVLTVDQAVPLPGNGLIAGNRTIATKRAALRAFVAATLRAMAEITADPQKGLDASIAAVPTLGKADRAIQLAVLKATIATWSNAYTRAHGPGSIDRAAWATTVTFMAGLPDSPISGTPPTLDQLLDESLLPS
ncbi:MAG TPA: ABC transporter substrate-binding protein [Candidatus Limnocylindria bacterium]|nr:ABC transporter substrate-binding protein [Candidatus Limnocylindria bacterium]